MRPRILVLGAGFGGLELATIASEALGDEVDVTLIDKRDTFVFGFSKLDVMFGRTTLDAVALPYRKSPSAASASCRRRSSRSTRRLDASQRMPVSTTATTS